MRNSHNGNVGLEKITITNLQHISSADSPIMYLKQRKSSRNLCYYNRRDTIRCTANDTVTVCCDCRCTGTETAELSVQ